MFEIPKSIYSSEIGCKFAQTNILLLDRELLQAGVKTCLKKVNDSGSEHVTWLILQIKCVKLIQRRSGKRDKLFPEIAQMVLGFI